MAHARRAPSDRHIVTRPTSLMRTSFKPLFPCRGNVSCLYGSFPTYGFNAFLKIALEVKVSLLISERRAINSHTFKTLGKICTKPRLRCKLIVQEPMILLSSACFVASSYCLIRMLFFAFPTDFLFRIHVSIHYCIYLIEAQRLSK
jgi:hypothetical protein